LVPTDARHFYIVHWLVPNTASRRECFLATSVLACIFQEKNAPYKVMPEIVEISAGML
jgi:hypothetical protein